MAYARICYKIYAEILQDLCYQRSLDIKNMPNSFFSSDGLPPLPKSIVGRRVHLFRYPTPLFAFGGNLFAPLQFHKRSAPLTTMLHALLNEILKIVVQNC